MQWTFMAGETWTGMRKNLTMTMALVIVIAVSLTLFGVGLLVRQQVAQMKGYWFDKVEVSVFLCTDTSQQAACADGAVTAEQRAVVQSALESLAPAVTEVYFESSDEAFARFQEQFAGSPIAETATASDLGESFRVKLADPNNYAIVADNVSSLPGVELVDDQKATLEQLFSLLDGMQIAALLIAVTMLVVTLLLVGNTMRLAAHTRRRETAIMRLVGASKAYIRMPFVAESVLAALAGAVIAISILSLLKALVIDRMLAPAFEFTPFVGWDAIVTTSVVLIVIGVTMAAMSSLVSLRRFLNV